MRWRVCLGCRVGLWLGGSCQMVRRRHCDISRIMDGKGCGDGEGEYMGKII